MKIYHAASCQVNIAPGLTINDLLREENYLQTCSVVVLILLSFVHLLYRTCNVQIQKNKVKQKATKNYVKIIFVCTNNQFLITSFIFCLGVYCKNW